MTSSSRSGMAWLQGVPSTWELMRFGSLAAQVKRVDVADAELLSLYLGEGVIPYKADRVVHATSEDRSLYQLVEPGDLVMNNQQAWRGSVAISARRGVISPAYFVFRVSPRLDGAFASYLFSSEAATYPYTLSSRGVGTIQRNLHWPTLKDQKIPVPPLAEQRLIADFLDAETARIDTLIAEQERFIALLRERRVAILDQHFQDSKGKRRATIGQVLRKVWRHDPEGLKVVTAYRDGVVTLRSNRREDGYTFSDTERGYQEVLPGDVVFHGLDGFAGAVGVSDSHGICTPVYHVCELVYDDVPEYVAICIRNLGTSGLLATLAPNVRQRAVDFRNWGTFSRVPLSLPARDEQERFVRWYKERKAKTDALIAEAEHNIALSRERRAALITEAVTGRIDVSSGRAA